MIPNQEQVLNALRTMLAFFAGLAVSHGWLTETTATQLVGASVVLVPLIWGMISTTAANKVKAAAAVPDVAKVVIKPVADSSVAAVATDPSQPKVTTGG